jgi:hypothetical protein
LVTSEFEMTATSRQFQYQAPFPEFRARQRKKKSRFQNFSPLKNKLVISLAMTLASLRLWCLFWHEKGKMKYRSVCKTQTQEKRERKKDGDSKEDNARERER